MDPGPSCNCRDKSKCPIPGKCTTTSVVNMAEVRREDNGTTTTYTGLTGGFFKDRWQGHQTSFRHEKYKNSTKLSLYIWSLNVNANANVFANVSSRYQMNS